MEDTKLYLQEVGWVEWSGLIWIRIGTGNRALLNAVMNCQTPRNAWNFWTS